MDEKGEVRMNGKIANEKRDFTLLKKYLGEPCRGVIEAGRNWRMMYDSLEELDVERVVAQSSLKQGQLLMQRSSLMQ